MKLKHTARRIGNGLLDGFVILADTNTQAEIDNLDKQLEALSQQMADLHEKKAELVSRLSTSRR